MVALLTCPGLVNGPGPGGMAAFQLLREPPSEPAGKAFRGYILQALQAKKQGDSEVYDMLLQQVEGIHSDPGKLRTFVQCVSYFDEAAHEALLLQLLGVSLWTCSEAVGDAMLDFLLHLASANSACVQLCLDMLVRNFLPPSSGIPAFMGVARRGGPTGAGAILAAGKQRAEELGRRAEVVGKVQAALQRLAQLVPTTASRLLPVLLHKLPHKRTDKEFQCLYLEGMFRLAESAAGEALRDRILVAAVDRLIDIDVEIRWEDILESADDPRGAAKLYMFHMDLSDSEDEVEPSGPPPHGPGSEAAVQYGLVARGRGGSVPTLDEMADKMDALMDLTFRHIQRRCQMPRQLSALYGALLHAFQSTILDTYKSKFTQFLLFYCCSLSPDQCGAAFAADLCNIVMAVTRSPNTRMSAAAYVASFLARASFLPLPIISATLARLASWCLAYATHASQIAGSAQLDYDVRLHSVFYSACQALLYVLCYRMPQLAGSPTELQLLHGLPLRALLSHPLNPLKMCLESVVQEFARQAKHVPGLRLSDVLEAHFRMQQARACFGGKDQLDMFFPFDPYLLQQSARFIKPNFNRWRQPFYGDEEDDEDDDDNEEEEEGAASQEGLEDAGEASSSDSEEEVPDRMAESCGTADLVWGSSGDTAPVSLEHRQAANTGAGKEGPDGKMETGLGVEKRHCPGSVDPAFGTEGFGSDSDLDDDLDAMSLTPPARALPAALPARLPARLK